LKPKGTKWAWTFTITSIRKTKGASSGHGAISGRRFCWTSYAIRSCGNRNWYVLCFIFLV